MWLCKENAKSFYDNLELLYTLHKYLQDCIWNCDEFRAQVMKNVVVL